MDDDTPAPVLLHALHLLLVDDDEWVRTACAEVLRLYGCRVTEGADGAECVRLACECRPAAILLDLRMPGTDGWEALRLLRAAPETASIPVIAFTSDTSESVRHRALQAGFDAFMAKPLTADALVRELERALAEIAARRRNGSGPASHPDPRLARPRTPPDERRVPHHGEDAAAPCPCPHDAWS